MDNILNSPHISNSLTMLADAAPVGAVNRRTFMRFLTVGVAAVAVQGCGGDVASAGAAAPVVPVAPIAPVAPQPAPVVAAPNPAAVPVWADIPAISFTQGTPSTISVANYITVADAAVVTLTLNQTPLPPGVTFNAATRSFDYDGSGSVAVADGFVLTAIVG
jgi:hypothetical protein